MTKIFRELFPDPATLRRSGYVRDQIAIIHRHLTGPGAGERAFARRHGRGVGEG